MAIPYKPDPELEERQNRETTPPPGELIELQCLYVAEAYLPSHAAGLYAGMRELGWDRGELGGEAPLDWVRATREYGSAGGFAPVGWLTTGPSHPPSRRTELPAEVSYAYAMLWAVSPGLTILTVQFLLSDKQAGVLDRVLRTRFGTYTTPTERGRRIHDPATQKRAALRMARYELRARCGAWLAERVPGAFADGLLGGEWPGLDVITAEEYTPFTGGRDGLWDYREVARLDGGLDIYESPQVEGLRLCFPSMADDPAHVLTLGGRKSELFSPERLEGYHDGSAPREAFASWLQLRIEDLVVAFGCIQLLVGYQRQLSSAIDRGLEITDQTRRAIEILRGLRQSHLPRCWDAQTLASEMELLCDQPYAEPFRGLDWSRIKNGPRDVKPLGARWRDRARYLARLLRRTEARFRETLATGTDLTAAAADLRLQRQVAILASISLIVAIAGVLLALLRP